MTTTTNRLASQSNPVNAEAMLRDLAYVLRLSRNVKQELLSERATTASPKRSISTIETETCAV